jgi:hypothetical protein
MGGEMNYDLLRDRIQDKLTRVDEMGNGHAPTILARLRQLAMTEASSATEALDIGGNTEARMYFNRFCGVVAAMEIVYDEMGG